MEAFDIYGIGPFSGHGCLPVTMSDEDHHCRVSGCKSQKMEMMKHAIQTPHQLKYKIFPE